MFQNLEISFQTFSLIFCKFLKKMLSKHLFSLCNTLKTKYLNKVTQSYFKFKFLVHKTFKKKLHLTCFFVLKFLLHKMNDWYWFLKLSVKKEIITFIYWIASIISYLLNLFSLILLKTIKYLVNKYIFPSYQ